MPTLLSRPAALAAMFTALAPGVAFAGSEHSLSGSIVRLQPTMQPGAVAEVIFENRAVNSPIDVSTFPLDLAGVTVQITFRWNTNPAGDDEIVIETDPDHVVGRRDLVVHEGQSGTAYIYPLESVGFCPSAERAITASRTWPHRRGL